MLLFHEDDVPRGMARQVEDAQVHRPRLDDVALLDEIVGMDVDLALLRPPSQAGHLVLVDGELGSVPVLQVGRPGDVVPVAVRGHDHAEGQALHGCAHCRLVRSGVDRDCLIGCVAAKNIAVCPQRPERDPLEIHDPHCSSWTPPGASAPRYRVRTPPLFSIISCRVASSSARLGPMTVPMPAACGKAEGR